MTKRISIFSVIVLAVAGIIAGAALFSQTARADSTSTDFETFSTGTVHTQDGWTSAGAAGSGCAVYDHAVTSNSYGFASFGTKVLRISNAVTSGCFGDQTFSKSLVNEAGEVDSTSGLMSGGTRQPHFEAQFDFASTQSTQQPGLFVSVSPDRGDGSRMSYLGFSDEVGGIDVIFYDTPGTSNPANFSPTTVATGLSRTVTHTAKFVIDYVDGPSNDVVKIYIDGVLVHTGTTWENYFRFDSEASAEQTPRTTDSLIFRTGGTAVPATAGNGFIFDNLSLMSGPTPPPVTVTIVKYVDGVHADTNSAEGQSFPMASCWSATNIGAGCGNFSLAPVGFNNPNPYEATTADMTAGADYSINEVTGGPVVGADCSTGQPFRLVGYTTGDSLSAAQSGTPTTTSPAFTNITSDTFVIVWNQDCTPKLTVTKIVVNDNGGTATTSDFTLFIDNATTSSGVATTTTVGAHVVSETANPNYSSTIGGDCDAQGNVTLAAGESKNCTITNDDIPPLLKVHILKYLDGVKATAASSSNYQFPMESTWKTANLNGSATSTGNYVLGNNHGGAADQYGADTASMQSPANYATHELTGGVNQPISAGAACVTGQYRLVGYSTSATSFAAAASSTISTSTPEFFGLTSDQYVIVWNEKCVPPPPPPSPIAACNSQTPPPGYTLLNGSAGHDKVTLTPGTMFVGHGGNDKVTGPDGNYIICLGNGHDKVTLGNGNADIDAGGGNNTVVTGNGNGSIYAGVDNDKITTGTGNHTINAGEGNNTIITGDGTQNVTTLSGVDKITTGNGSDTIAAGEGNNKVKAGGGADTITAGAGNDTVDGGAGTDSCNAGGGINNVSNCP